MELKDKLNMRVRDLNVSIRCWNTLRCNAKIEYVDDLMRWSEDDLLRLSNFGIGSLKEIKEALNGLGVALEKSNIERKLKKQQHDKKAINRSISNQLDRLEETKKRYYRHVANEDECMEDDLFIKAILDERKRIESDK